MLLRTRRFAPLLLVGAAACSPAFETGHADGGGPAGLSDAASETTQREASLVAPDAAGDDGSNEDAAAPPVTQGLLLWLRGDLGITAASGTVSSWADQSGNHLDARQPDPLGQPMWTTVGLSGRPAVVFNADNFLSLPGGFTDFSRGISIFAVAAITDAASCVDIVHLSNGPEIDDIAFGRHDGRVLYEVLDGVLHGDVFPLGRAKLMSVVHGADGSVSLRLDGAGPSTGTFDLPSTAIRTSNVIGRSLYADCGSVHGGIAEVLVYRRALDDSERGMVEGYLQTRWDCCR
jgi:hypothetical protein